ncbi:MAG: hypothetical protein GY838_06705 [bacterium]|nr:hypothetical protein [bacterium]
MPSSLVLATLGPGDLLGLILDSTFFGKFILLVLLFLSVMSWAVFVDKARQMNRIRAGHQEFWQKVEEWLDGRLRKRDLVAWATERSDLPLANLMTEVDGLDRVPAVRRGSERVIYLEMEGLERYLILLSTAVTISPFLGLMGTVWGIMTSFWDMSTMQSANLTVVAPGIAEALTTTIAGLATAIPAVIFYNSLVRKIDLVANELDRLRTILEEDAGSDHGLLGPAGRDRVRRPGRHEGEKI